MSDNLTPEQKAEVAKLTAACEKAASQGFIAQCKAAGLSDDKTAGLHETYLAQREKRASKVEEMRAAILNEKS